VKGCLLLVLLRGLHTGVRLASGTVTLYSSTYANAVRGCAGPPRAGT
jgi:hypothetical protein